MTAKYATETVAIMTGEMFDEGDPSLRRDDAIPDHHLLEKGEKNTRDD
jgi:hypothetical protein